MKCKLTQHIVYSFGTLFCCMAVFFAAPLFGQEVNQKDAQGRKQGKWVKYHEGMNTPAYVGEFKNDKPVGTFTYYYPSTKVKAIIKHEPSGRSEAFFYYENKNLLGHGIYRDQKKDSVWTHYSPEGNLSYKETYKNDLLHGVKTIYYIPERIEDRRVEIMREETYTEGVLHGPVREYFQGGGKKMEANYVDGRPNGAVRRYHPNGKVENLERYKNRLRHGWWINYDPNGKEIARTYYLDGRPIEGQELEKHLELLKKHGIGPND
jgi:antitoxin component YwqK of YwqJK toxin-antitoxin module